MKRCALLLITAILSLNCMAQSNKQIVLNLQQVEFTDDSFKQTLLTMAKDRPDEYQKNEHLVMDFYKSSLSVDQSFIFIYEYSPYDKFLHVPTYYSVFNDCFFFLPRETPSNIIKVLPTVKKFTFLKSDDLLGPVGGPYFGIVKKNEENAYQILHNCGVGE